VARAFGFWGETREGASLVNRGAVTELRNHAVRSWETREANASEEPGSAKRKVLQVAK
jgi:hypothetical protein